MTLNKSYSSSTVKSKRRKTRSGSRRREPVSLLEAKVSETGSRRGRSTLDWATRLKR